MSNRKLRFGIMCSRKSIPAWQEEILKSLVESDIASPELLILDGRKGSGKKELISRLLDLRNLFWNAFWVFARKRFRALRSVDSKFLTEHLSTIRCEIRKKGKFSEYFKAEDVQGIKEYELDFVLRFGFGIIRGEILNVARYGVWSFHHDDETKYRGGPACFWEIQRGDPVTGAILQRLTDRLDGGIVLKRGYLKTNPSYIKNRDQIYFESSRWPLQICRKILSGNDELLFASPSTTKAPIYKKPGNIDFLIFTWQSLKGKALSVYKKVCLVDYWNIGVTTAPIKDFLLDEKPETNWFPLKSTKRFVADAFAFPSENKDLNIFFEDFPYATGKGTINHVAYSDGQFADQDELVLETQSHLSYPFPFQDGDRKYIIPESHQSNRIDLYVLDENSIKPTFQETLIDAFPGVDNTLYFHNSKYWIFTSNRSDGVHHNLYLFYADSLTGDWKPHPLNPVKTDIRASRCAGTIFEVDNVLYRPSMDYSRKIEGRISINKIVKLTETEFEEKFVKYIDPYIDSDFPDKIHTLCDAGNRTVIDGAREVSIFTSYEALKFKARKLKGKFF